MTHSIVWWQTMAGIPIVMLMYGAAFMSLSSRRALYRTGAMIAACLGAVWTIMLAVIVILAVTR